jgi:hypothetical protein
VIYTLTKYNYNDEVEEDYMGGACCMNGEKMKAYRLLVGKPGEKER